MSRYDLSISSVVTDGGKPFTTQQPFTWHNLDQDGFAAILGLLASVANETKQAANKGGQVSVTFTSKATSSDGGQVPPEANGSLSFSGIDRHGLHRVQKAMHKIGEKLVDFGRVRAEHKAKTGK